MDDKTIIAWIIAFVASEIFRYILFAIGGLIIGGLLTMFGTLMFGRNYKNRITSLERKIKDRQESIWELIAVEKIEAVNPLVGPDEEAWNLTPGHGELAAAVMHAQPTLNDARRVYRVFDAAESKTNAEYGYAAWASWLTRFGDPESEGYDFAKRLIDLKIDPVDVLKLRDG